MKWFELNISYELMIKQMMASILTHNSLKVAAIGVCNIATIV